MPMTSRLPRPRTPLVMVLNNDPALANVLTEWFTLSGYQAYPILRTDGALDRIRIEQPDLLVIDSWLETRDAGWELLIDLQRDPSTSHIPTILLADESLSELAPRNVRLMQDLATTILRKPFDFDDLLSEAHNPALPTSAY